MRRIAFSPPCLSGKIGIVERELVRLYERKDIGPVLFDILACGLFDRVKFEGDHGYNSRGGDGF